MENWKLIYKQMSLIMGEVEAIKKERLNSSQNYKFRWIDDCYNMLHDIMAKHEVMCVPKVLEVTKEEKVNSKGNTVFYFYNKVEYTFYAVDWSSITAITPWEAMDSGDKSSNKAMSSAHKVCLLQTFMIRTEDDNDTENTSHEIISKEKPLITKEQLQVWLDKVKTLVDDQKEYPSKPKLMATISERFALDESAYQTIENFYITLMF